MRIHRQDLKARRVLELTASFGKIRTYTIIAPAESRNLHETQRHIRNPLNEDTSVAHFSAEKRTALAHVSFPAERLRETDRTREID